MQKKTSKSDPEFNLKKLRKRDKKEIAHWFEIFCDPVYGFIYYRVGKDADLAGEAPQETFSPGSHGLRGNHFFLRSALIIDITYLPFIPSKYSFFKKNVLLRVSNSS